MVTAQRWLWNWMTFVVKSKKKMVWIHRKAENRFKHLLTEKYLHDNFFQFREFEGYQIWTASKATRAKNSMTQSNEELKAVINNSDWIIFKSYHRTA